MRCHRGLFAPDHPVLLNFPNGRLHFFHRALGRKGFIAFTGLIVLAARALFLMNALAGRIWGLSLSADGLDRPVLCARALG